MLCLERLTIFIALAVIANSPVEFGLCPWALPPTDRWSTVLGMTDVIPVHTLYCMQPSHVVIGRCGEFFRPKPTCSPSSTWLALLLIMSGVEANPGPNYVNFGFVNGRSIVKKGPLIIDLIDSQSPTLDLLAVCETWIVNDDPDAIKMDCVPDGFRVIHRPRPSAARGTRGGGLCVIYRDTLSVRVHPRQRSADHYESFECLLLSVDVGGGGHSKDCDTVAIIYRPPSSSSTSLERFYDDFSDLLVKLGDTIDIDRFVTFGDFNCGSEDPRAIRTELMTLLEAHDLQQHVSTATRTTSTTSSLLDLIINHAGSSRVSTVNVTSTHGVSDHDLVTGQIATRTRPPRCVQTYSFRNMKHVDWNQFRSDLNSSELFSAPANTADSFADQIDTVVTELLDNHCPVQKRSKFTSARRDNRWLSAESTLYKRHRRRLERQWRKSKNQDDYIAYRKACRITNHAILESRRNYYSDKINAAEKDPRRRWAAIRDVLHQTESPDVMTSDACRHLCDSFADFFGNKIRIIKAGLRSKLNETIAIVRNSDTADSSAVDPKKLDPMKSDVRHTGQLLTDLQPPSVEEVSKLIKAMPAKSSVVDSIPTSVIKQSVDIFAKLIVRLATLSFNEGCFPTRYKTASVTPLLKKKGVDRDNSANYRPISNLHTISKILERILMSRLVAHVERSPSYNRYQSAYRKGYSTETAITRLLNDIYCNADNKARTLLLQLDLSAAFDTIDIGTLHKRLEHTFGISGRALQWLKSYLNERTQFIRVGNQQSGCKACEYGVPQGSVLGPLLFTLFVAPVANVIAGFNVSHSQYADDTQLYIALNDDQALPSLSNCCTEVYNWFLLNGLSLNPDKSEAIVIGTGARQRSEGSLDYVAVGDTKIHPSESVKSLGVIIDDKLTFNAHVNSVCKAAHFHTRALRHIRKCVSEQVALSIASSMIGARLDYCNSIMYGMSISNFQKLQRVQNSLARIVTGTRRSEHISPVLARLHWLPLIKRVEYKIALLTFKVVTTQQPGYLHDLVKFHTPVRELRSNSKINSLHINNSRTVFASRAFCHAAPTIWNSLPAELTEDLSSLNSFKSRLKSHLFRKAFRH